MQTRSQRRVFAGGLFVLLLGAFTIYLAAVIRGPDRNLHFERVVPSELDAATLGKNIHIVLNWPKWHFNMADVRLTDLKGREYAQRDQSMIQGSLIHYKVEPPTRQWKRFDLYGQAQEYVRDKKLRVRMIADSTGRLSQLFDRLEWTIELLPRTDGPGTLIRGTVDAHTANWRARLFGTLTERILLNQVFYPDLEKLAGLRQPLSLDPVPQTQQ